MKKKVTLDTPRSPSLWPQPKLIATSEVDTIISTIPNYIERAREAMLCIESRCDRAVKKGATQPQQVALEGIRGQCRMMLEQLTLARQSMDAIIAELKDSGLF